MPPSYSVAAPRRAKLGLGDKHFVWPWGKLYFILDEPTKREMDLVTFIRQRMGHKRSRQSLVRTFPVTSQALRFILILVLTATV
jgi:hypothetical protein